jgi:hypothetical protein
MMGSGGKRDRDDKQCERVNDGTIHARFRSDVAPSHCPSHTGKDAGQPGAIAGGFRSATRPTVPRTLSARVSMEPNASKPSVTHACDPSAKISVYSTVQPCRGGSGSRTGGSTTPNCTAR